MEAGHNHPNSLGWQASRSWDLLHTNLHNLPGFKSHRKTSTPKIHPPLSAVVFPTWIPSATLHHISLGATGSQSGRKKTPDRKIIITKTVLMAIDFSKAFHTVNHTKLLWAVSNSTLPPNYVRWLVAYKQDHSAACRYYDSMSVCNAVRTGVPQGSTISPFLLNCFVATYPQNL